MKYILYLFGTLVSFGMFYLLAFLAGFFKIRIEIPGPNYVVCLAVALLLLVLTTFLTKKYYSRHRELILCYFVLVTILFLYNICNFLYEFLYLITPYDIDDPCYTKGNADIILLSLSLLIWGLNFDIVKNKIIKNQEG